MDQMAGPALAGRKRSPVLSGLADGLRDFAANRKTYLAIADPEALHRLRIAMRRMRTALSILKDHAGDARIAGLATQTRRVFAATGHARECDVFAARIKSDKPVEGLADTAKLIDIVEAHRRSCHAEAHAFLAGGETQACMRNIEAFLDSAGPGFAAGPRKVLGRLYKRTRKRGRQFARLGDDGRHELRIALKKLRYGTEFFRENFGRKRRYAKLLAATGKLQDLLGAHNDHVSAGAFLDNLPGAEAPELAKARRVVIETYKRTDEDSAASLVRAWKKFKRAKPFWR
ncbi:MAG TPA: CHAD domain-containing protein [Rhizobiaceae bacterium]|nr:CHAD domain-containing protein [Rhizobiaceae bacterium]